MSMKRAINTIIRTKLQALEEKQEEGPEEEEEIGLITPANLKGPSTGEPPEPDLGMLPLGPRKTVGGQPKPSTSAQQRLKPKSKPSARSVRETQGTGKEERGKTQEGSSQDGKERWPESSKGWSGEALQISAGNCCPEADQAVSKIHRAFDQEAALSVIGARNCK